VCETKEDVENALARLARLARPADSPIALHMLCEDPSPVRATIAGVALANGKGERFYVPFGTAAWPALAAWLADPRAPKIGHNLVVAAVELRRAGVVLAG